MNVVGEVLDTSPITSTQPLERPRELHSELRRLVKGERGIIDGERLQNFVFPTNNYGSSVKCVDAYHAMHIVLM